MDKHTTAPMAIPTARLDGPPSQATAIIRQPKENDAKALHYDWFLHIGKTVCEVGDAYKIDRMSGLGRARRAAP